MLHSGLHLKICFLFSILQVLLHTHHLDPPLRHLPLDPPLQQRLQRYQLWILTRYSVNCSNTESSIKNLRRINLRKYQISQVFWIKSSKCEYISYFIGTWPEIIFDLIIFQQGVIYLTPCFHHNIYRLKCHWIR